MQKIIPHIWFDTTAQEAANFYTSVFDDAHITSTTYYPDVGKEIHGMEAGTVLTVGFQIAGQEFVGLNGGPNFTLNPSISFIVNCATREEVDALYEKLSEGGSVLMPLDTYPFSERFGWVSDKYGVSWQLMLADGEGGIKQKITPSLLFVGDVYGEAEAALNFYTSVFEDTQVGDITRYEKGQEPDKEGAVLYARFSLEGQWFGVQDSAYAHDFAFNEAISFMVICNSQQEIDYFWEKLSAVPGAEACGWVKDKFGVSWQIVPDGMEEMLNSTDAEKANRAMEAMLQMKKIDIALLQQAFEGIE